MVIPVTMTKKSTFIVSETVSTSSTLQNSQHHFLEHGFAWGELKGELVLHHQPCLQAAHSSSLYHRTLLFCLPFFRGLVIQGQSVSCSGLTVRFLCSRGYWRIYLLRRNIHIQNCSVCVLQTALGNKWVTLGAFQP